MNGTIFVEKQKHLMPTVKHGGGGLMIGTCFVATGSGPLKFIESLMNSSLYQPILEVNVRSSVEQLKFGTNCIMQQDNDP